MSYCTTNTLIGWIDDALPDDPVDKWRTELAGREVIRPSTPEEDRVFRNRLDNLGPELTSYYDVFA